ncbi:MAG: DUF2493 domain-containing protein [Myxococcales bacterium]|nr:DUF2493 domain-containing protein [Myxococcales bacterium]
MRTRVAIVCGGRNLQAPDGAFVRSAAMLAVTLRRVLELTATTCVRHGDAPGADQIANRVARALGLDVDPVPADWSIGRGGGPRRNAAMLRREPIPELVIALPGEDGTADMMAKAADAGLPRIVIDYDGPRLVIAEADLGSWAWARQVVNGP